MHSYRKFFPRVNGKIRAQQVRVVGKGGHKFGIMPLSEALTLARSMGVDLIEAEPLEEPPVCLLMELGKFAYEQAREQRNQRN